MPKFVKTMEVEVEFDYRVDPPEPDVGLSDWTLTIWVHSIDGAKAEDRYTNVVCRDLDDKLVARVEEEIRDEYLQGEQ